MSHKTIEMFNPTNKRAVVRDRRGMYSMRLVAIRDGKEYVQLGSGFARICAKVGDTWLTSVSGVTVIELGEL